MELRGNYSGFGLDRCPHSAARCDLAQLQRPNMHERRYLFLSFRAKRGISLRLKLRKREIPRFARNDKSFSFSAECKSDFGNDRYGRAEARPSRASQCSSCGANKSRIGIIESA